eukprot:jgi/Mesen1/2664/ME000167S01812
MLSRLVNSFGQLAGRVTKQKFVGTDLIGNKYFKAPKVVDGAEVERRWVEFKGSADPTKVPVLKKEEDKRLFRARVLQADASADDFTSQDLKRYLKQIKQETSTASPGGQSNSEEARTSLPGGSHFGSDEEIPDGPASAPSGSFRPGTWQPPDPPSREPKGRAESFQPGMWEPPEPTRR